MEQQPVVHHIELCVGDRDETLKQLKKFGFDVFARRETPNSTQIVTKLGTSIFFLITERKKQDLNHGDGDSFRTDGSLPSLLCCEREDSHIVDTVFNIALNVTDVKVITEKVALNGGSVIVPPRTVTDKFGHVSFAVVKSICGNVVHTLLNKSQYRGIFLPGFEIESNSIKVNSRTVLQDIMTHVDHVTLACRDTSSVISFYQMCFGMQKINISLRSEEEDEGLVVANGVGIRLRAMEYYRCQETGLVYSPSPCRNSNANVMFVVVESLPGQTNCNVETFLREHRGPGVEHVALSTKNMYEAVSLMSEKGCIFRKPPNTYYRELRKNVDETGEDIAALRKLGILLDKEPDSEENAPKYLMQIFSLPIFCRKTFFMELIHRNGARGLGAGNIIALVRSIREEERLKMQGTKEGEIRTETVTNVRSVS